ncbi:MAG: hypothetical protein HY078_03825 [Elusimicrobia bacterium]|nr:hypothetical protein [Elusimicrobiota bacterium]
MDLDRKFLLLLSGSPLVAFALHAGLSRALRRFAPQSAYQGVAGLAVLLGYPALLLLAWGFVFSRVRFETPPIAALVYGAFVYSGLAFAYVQVYNMSETSRRIHILTRLSKGPASAAEFSEKYSPERQLAIRLERLVSLGQIRLEDGRYALASKPLWLIARAMDGWARVLGYPSRAPKGA